MKVFVARLAGAFSLSLLLAPAPAPAAAPVGRYTASGGVVQDNKTGLHWQQAAAPLTYTFANAVAYCSGNAAALPGNGWRLPALKELQTLVDYSVGSPGPTIDASAFPSTPTVPFWSSTPYAGSASGAWLVHFGTSDSTNIPTTNMVYVRCVR